MKSLDETTRIVLASTSPRRRDLLKMMGLRFEVLPSTKEEVTADGLAPDELVCALAAQKALDIRENERDALIIGADTVVALEGVILGKPVDENDARRMLSLLQGRSHTVYTGLCVILGDALRLRAVATRVTFSPMSEGQIRAYVRTGESLDKAGAYAIQGLGGMFIEGIEGCYYNAMGLPLSALRKLLEELGYGLCMD